MILSSNVAVAVGMNMCHLDSNLGNINNNSTEKNDCLYYVLLFNLIVKFMYVNI